MNNATQATSFLPGDAVEAAFSCRSARVSSKSALGTVLAQAIITRKIERGYQRTGTMKSRMVFAAGVLGALVSSPAFAQEGNGATIDGAPKMRAIAQLELLPVGSGKMSAMGTSDDSIDTAVAYGISAGFDYAITPYLSIGVAPRLVLNVDQANNDMEGDADTEIDLRARITGHYPVARGLEINASVMPGYTIVVPAADGVSNATGFAIGGAVGLTYDLSPRMFLTGEVGYQRAFTSAEIDLGAGKLDADLELSYMHVGLGAGTRF